MSIISLLHRILGETMLLIALAGVVLASVGLLRKQEMERTERIFGMAYAGLLDLQALLGLIYFIWLPGAARPSLLHPVLMAAAVVVVHVSRTWRSSPVPTRHRAQLAAYGLSLVLVFAGRMLMA